MREDLLKQDSAIFNGLNAELIDVVAQELEKGVGKGHFEEAELDEEHLVAEQVEVFGDGLLVLLDDGIHLPVLEFD